MISILIELYIIYVLFSKKELLKKRKLLFNLTVICSVLIFSSHDLVTRLPIYMVPMIFSIILRGVQLKIPKQVFELFIIIIAILIIPIVLLGFGAVTNKYFLINYSNADAYNGSV